MAKDYTRKYIYETKITDENQYPNKKFFEEKGFNATHLEMRLNR